MLDGTRVSGIYKPTLFVTEIILRFLRVGALSGSQEEQMAVEAVEVGQKEVDLMCLPQQARARARHVAQDSLALIEESACTELAFYTCICAFDRAGSGVARDKDWPYQRG